MLYYKMFFMLMIGHFLFDVIWQSDAVSKGKNPLVVLPIHFNQTTWPYFLTAHSLSHAFAVLISTNNYIFATIEFVSHWWIDYSKCMGWFGTKYNMHIDQGLHIGFKVLYLVLIYLNIG